LLIMVQRHGSSATAGSAISGVIIQGAGTGTAFLAAVGLGLGGQGAAPGKTLVAPGRMAAASHVRAKRV